MTHRFPCSSMGTIANTDRCNVVCKAYKVPFSLCMLKGPFVILCVLLFELDKTAYRDDSFRLHVLGFDFNPVIIHITRSSILELMSLLLLACPCRMLDFVFFPVPCCCNFVLAVLSEFNHFNSIHQCLPFNYYSV